MIEINNDGSTYTSGKISKGYKLGLLFPLQSYVFGICQCSMGYIRLSILIQPYTKLAAFWGYVNSTSTMVTSTVIHSPLPISDSLFPICRMTEIGKRKNPVTWGWNLSLNSHLSHHLRWGGVRAKSQDHCFC